MKFCPPNFDDIDKCLINQVVDEKNNETFGSHMKCAKNDDWRKVCEFWKVPGLCDSTDNKVKMDTKISYSNITKLEKCFYLLFTNATINEHESSLYCPGNRSKIEMKCEAEFDSDNVSELFAGATDEQVKSTYQFWTFFMMLIISWCGMAVVVSIGDAICFEMLGSKPQRFG